MIYIYYFYDSMYVLYAPMNGLVLDIWRFISFSNNNNNNIHMVIAKYLLGRLFDKRSVYRKEKAEKHFVSKQNSFVLHICAAFEMPQFTLHFFNNNLNHSPLYL